MLVIVVSTIAIAMRRAITDFRAERAEALRWHADFEDLPDRWRRCRHELTGEVASRTCPNAFDCRHCAEHPKFVAARTSSTLAANHDPVVAGFAVPADRLYHRGHTWVRQDDYGVLTVGLDDFGAHLLGTPDEVRLPEIGSHVVTNGTGWRAKKNGVSVRVLAPIDGEVVDVGGPDKGWYLKVRPDTNPPDTRHLLTVTEAKLWMLRELERLQTSVATEGVGAALADGGMPVENLSDAIPADRRDAVMGMMFLNA